MKKNPVIVLRKGVWSEKQSNISQKKEASSRKLFPALILERDARSTSGPLHDCIRDRLLTGIYQHDDTQEG